MFASGSLMIGLCCKILEAVASAQRRKGLVAQEAAFETRE
jgi:hypothetical protein